MLRHLFGGPWQTRLHFPKTTMRAIEAAIQESERTHSGELRFAVEATLPVTEALRGITARQRAIEVFSNLRIWDTEDNNGVLIYLLLADHDVEIVADRGVHKLVGADGWEAICRAMEAEFRVHHFENGVLLGIARITEILQQHFPAQGGADNNELPDAPVAL
jgi:uncharacterized membrane protein